MIQDSRPKSDDEFILDEETEGDVLRLLNAGISLLAASKVLSLRYWPLRRALLARGHSSDLWNTPKPLGDLASRAERLFKDGMALRDACTHLHVGWQRIATAFEADGKPKLMDEWRARHRQSPFDPLEAAARLAAGERRAEVASSVGVSVSSLERSLRRAGYELASFRAKGRVRIADLAARSVTSDWDAAKLAAHYGVGEETIISRLRAMGISPQVSRPQGGV